MDMTTPYYHRLTDERHLNGSFNFDYTESEIADKDRILRDACNMEPVVWQCENRGCMKMHAQETMICGLCGSPVSGVPF
jgi:hypothetical protein